MDGGGDLGKELARAIEKELEAPKTGDEAFREHINYGETDFHRRDWLAKRTNCTHGPTLIEATTTTASGRKTTWLKKIWHQQGTTHVHPSNQCREVARASKFGDDSPKRSGTHVFRKP